MLYCSGITHAENKTCSTGGSSYFIQGPEQNLNRFLNLRVNNCCGYKDFFVFRMQHDNEAERLAANLFYL